RILEETLKSWAMRPVCVDGGEPALVELRRAAVAGEPYPLVLLDARMPDMDGLVLADRIQQSADLAGPTLLTLTPAANKDDGWRCACWRSRDIRSSWPTTAARPWRPWTARDRSTWS